MLHTGPQPDLGLSAGSTTPSVREFWGLSLASPYFIGCSALGLDSNRALKDSPASLAKHAMKKTLSSLIAVLLVSGISHAAPRWQSLFDGKTLNGWKPNESPATFNVKDGELVVKGPKAHLFYVGPVNGANFTNFEFQAEIKTMPKANSGVYFHTQYQDGGWPSVGYEVQVNNSHGDPKRTAGLYAIKDNYTAPAKDGEWFTLTIKVEGKHVITKVNGKVITDYTEPLNPEREKGMEKRLVTHGTFAIQGHDPGSESHYRKLKVRALP